MTAEVLGFTVEGVACAAQLFLPDGPGPHPIVVMGGGLGSTMALGTPETAAAFAAAGIAALTFDYRHWGDSGGEPRQLLSVAGQLADWEAAIATARTLPEIDPARVAIWGSSFGGGHAVTIAARHPELKSVVAQIPAVDFRAMALRTPLWTTLRLLCAGLRDALAAALGRPPAYIPLVGAPGSLAVMTAPDHLPGYLRLADGVANWRNEIAPRFLLGLALYRPIATAGRIASPLLLCVCDRDTAAPVDLALKAGALAPRAEITHYDCGHFDIEFPPWRAGAIADQVAFLRRYL